MSRRAKILTDDQLSQFIGMVTSLKNSLQNDVIINLSFRAGLRAAEIAGLEWRDVLNSDGTIGILAADGIRYLAVPNSIAKKGAGRDIPLHPALGGALNRLLKDRQGVGRIILGLKTGHPYATPDGITKYVKRLYQRFGLTGCTSHSGRRTFITNLARRTSDFDCSLHDVQKLAGHQSIKTTERYIEPTARAANMVSSL